MSETAETHLVAELALTESLVKLMVNMTVQLIISDGGSMSRARALMSTIEATGTFGPGIPKITPSVAAGYDQLDALRLAGSKANHTITFVLETAATIALKKGIKLSR